MTTRPWSRLLGLLLLIGLCQTALAGDFVFKRVLLYGQDGQFLLDADIDYKLNDTTLEALQNGVPLTFVTHVEVREAGAWIWEEDLVDLRLRSQVRYHPLSGLYELTDIDSGASHTFATRSALLSALGEIRGLELMPDTKLRPGKAYRIRLETYLDIESLPLPLRPLAHMSPSWHLGSDEWERLLTP